MSTAQEALDRAVDAWNAGDLDAYLRLYHDGIRLYGYAPDPMGKEEARAFYEGTLAGITPNRLDFNETLWDGNRCAIRFTMSGWHRGHMLGIPGTGRHAVVPGITILHFEGDQVVERWSQADLLGFLVQVGAVPAPA
jgi:predicted ester cyclase